MAASSDPPAVGRHDEEHLRRFLEARAQQDAVEMRRWWDELVVDFRDRMDGLVAVNHKGRLDDDEHDLAVQLALIRFARKLIDSFKGTSMGELVNASRTLAHFACVDVQRDAQAQRRHRAASFDDGWNRPADADGAARPWEAEAARRRHEADELGKDVRDFLAWALPQVIESRREVLALSLAGAPLEEICTRIGIERDNAYQRRSRGLKDLIKLKEQWDA